MRADVGSFTPFVCRSDVVETFVYPISIGLCRGFEKAVSHEVYEAVWALGALKAAPLEDGPLVVAHGDLLAHGPLQVFDARCGEVGLDVGAPLVGGGYEAFRPEAEYGVEEFSSFAYDGSVVFNVGGQGGVEGS